MKNLLSNNLLLWLVIFLSYKANAQTMHIGEVMVINNPILKENVKPEAFKTYFTKEVMPNWNKYASGNEVYLFSADRGDRKGSFMLVCTSGQEADRKKLPNGSPFADSILSGNDANSVRLGKYVTNSSVYTEYHLIGAKQLVPLPVAGLLGMHNIKVKRDSLASFEKFVTEKLNPTVGHLLPDLQLLYFKGVAGEKAGTYLLIFVLKSPASRDKYWPAGAPETDTLKKAFMPYKALAKQLGSYLEENSYLKPESGGAAAYFESLVWTDYIE